MSQPYYIGDEVSAIAWRLAGLRVQVPGDAEILETIRRSCEHAPLVLISAFVAEQLPDAERDDQLAQVTPPVVIVPDVSSLAALPDLTTRLRRQLGVLE